MSRRPDGSTGASRIGAAPACLTDAQRLQSFRDVRDELRRRLAAVFGR